MTDSITFLATFPAIQSAIKVGDLGMRIQLDIPESEMSNAVSLIALRDKVLRISVQIADTNPQDKGKRPQITSHDFTIVDA